MAYLLRNKLQMLTARHLLKVNGFIVQNHVYALSTITMGMWQKHNAVSAGAFTGAGQSRPTGQKNSKESYAKITLIQNDHVSVTALEEARNLAKRRSMHLVQVQEADAKTQRPVYKLISSADRLQEELSDITSQEKLPEKGNQKKSEKNLNIGSRISDNDLASRLKNISKWLAKRHEVRILIQGTEKEMTNSEKVYKAIEAYVKSPEIIGKIVQKRTKGSVIKFTIFPITTTSEDKTSSSSPQ